MLGAYCILIDFLFKTVACMEECGLQIRRWIALIKRFTCNGFRNITCNDLMFDRINILIGPNNAGKSNFIRALSFAANMVNNQKSESTGFLSEIKRNGWDQIADKRANNSVFHLGGEFEAEKNRPVEYTLGAAIGKKREDNFITGEALDSTEPHESYPRAYNEIFSP